MKHRPPNPGRTTQRIRLVDGTPKPFGEMEFGAMERPEQVGFRTLVRPNGRDVAGGGTLEEACTTCKRCGFHQCACKSGDYDARRKVVTGEHPARLETVTVDRFVPPNSRPGLCSECRVNPTEGGHCACSDCLDKAIAVLEKPPEQRRVRVEVGQVWHYNSDNHERNLTIHHITENNGKLICWNSAGETWGMHASIDRYAHESWTLVTPAPQPQAGRLENCTIELAAQMLEAGRVVSHPRVHKYRIHKGVKEYRAVVGGGEWLTSGKTMGEWIEYWTRYGCATGWTIEALP